MVSSNLILCCEQWTSHKSCLRRDHGIRIVRGGKKAVEGLTYSSRDCFKKSLHKSTRDCFKKGFVHKYVSC